LHLSPSAVSHRVRALEAFLGVSLFERLARRIELTDHGRAYMPAVRKAFDDLVVSTTALFGSMSQTRRLTVRAPISYVVSTIAPLLHRFTATHPTIELRLVSAIWADSLTAETTDLEIRFGSGHWPGHHVELLHRESAVAVWSPGFERRHQPVTGLGDLVDRPRARVLGFEDLGGLLSARSSRGPLTHADVTVDTSLAAIELALSGAYWTVVPTRFVTRYVADGRLGAATGEASVMSQCHYVVFPDTTRPPTPEALLFVDWLRVETS
jgi:LysR family glycine cleavage system transcriptional activator